jgi:hypothetical protein
MKLAASAISIMCVLGFGSLLLPYTSPADGAQHGAPAFQSAQGQEVVIGSYRCDGSVYTDDQAANINATFYADATSGITSGFYGTSSRSTDVPADLDAMAEICDAHIGHALAETPVICTLGPVYRERGDFGNGSSAVSGFDFSCQGARDEVIGVIGAFSRLALTARLL